MDHWLKYGGCRPRKDCDYSSNKERDNNEKKEGQIILKEPIKRKARKTRKYNK